MRTMNQIEGKVQKLKKRLVSKKVYENFGENEQRKLKEYVGDTYDYNYDDRLTINKMINEFFQWCGTYSDFEEIK